MSGPRSLIFTGLGVLAEALLDDPDKLLQVRELFPCAFRA